MGWGTEWEKQLEGSSGIKVKRKWGEADEESKDAGDGCRERGCTCQKGWSSGRGVRKRKPEEGVCWVEGGGPRLGVEGVGGWGRALGREERCRGPGGRRGCGEVERGEPMGWRTGRGRSWPGPRAFRTALAGGRGGGGGEKRRRAGAGSLEPEALGRPL